MSVHFQLIPWTLLTHAIDLLQYEEDNKETMTYQQLLQQLNELSPEELSQTVVIYDKDTEEEIRADDKLVIRNSKKFIGI
tara:strand:+ start:13731 stop:13970 length:240 start_codon:yes stop_codon:yes gene_type:complete